MTTDDQKLTEQIAQKLHEVDPISGHDPRWDRLLKMDREWYRIKAAAVLPIVAAEAQAASEKAWDEGHSWGWSDAQEAHDTRQVMPRSEWRLCTPNPYRTEQTDD